MEETAVKKPNKARGSSNRHGFIYFITPPHHCVVKMGFAVNVKRRLYDLQCASFVPLDIFDSLPGTMADEVALKDRFAKHRIRGEWYRFDDEIFDFVELAEEFRRETFARSVFDPRIHTTEGSVVAAIEAVAISSFVRDFTEGANG